MSRYIDADLIEYHDSFTNDGEYARVAFGDDIDVLPTADVVPTEFHNKCMQIEIEKRRNMVEVTHAHWIVDFAWNGWMDWTCSNCGYRKNIDVHVNLGYNFCPKCGAKMDNGGDAT